MTPANDITKINRAQYAAMRQLAATLLRRYRTSPSRKTSLVHWAYLRMAQSPNRAGRTDRRLLALAAQAMRCVLVDQARNRMARKRGFGAQPFPLFEWEIPAAMPDEALVELNESMRRLTAIDQRKARVVELRYFGGLSVEEVAGVLDISTATVKREWGTARAWLFGDLTRE